MSIPKEKLHKLIERLPDNDTGQNDLLRIVAELCLLTEQPPDNDTRQVIENYLKTIESKNLKKIYENPIKIKEEVIIPSRNERNER